MYANVDDDDDDDDDDGAEIYRRNAAPHTSPEPFHTKKSQLEPLYPEICRKNAAPQSQPRTQTHTLCEPAAVEMHVNISQEPLNTEIYRKNAGA